MPPEYLRWVFAISVALVPAIFYVRYIRNIEKYYREPWTHVMGLFLYGGLAALLFIGVTSFAYGALLREQGYYSLDKGILNVLLICLALPVLAEVMKLAGLPFIKGELDEVEDGLIHGAICGIGFAAVANMFYLYSSFTLDPMDLAIGAIPSISFLFLHASAGAVGGYGVSRFYVEGEKRYLLPYFLGGVVIHGGFNALSVATQTLEGVPSGAIIYLVGLLGVLLLSNLVFRTIRHRMHVLIKELDEETEKNRSEGRGEAKGGGQVGVDVEVEAVMGAEYSEHAGR